MRAARVAVEEEEDIRKPPKKRMTEPEFEAWCDEDTFAEWVDGEVVLMVPIGEPHAEAFEFLHTMFANFIGQKCLGEVRAEPMQIRFPKQRRRRSPDICFIAKQRTSIIKTNVIDGAPDLIVEIVSPFGISRDWREKYLEYEKAGVREYWIVDPNSQRVELNVMTKAGKYRTVPETDGKLRSSVLKGFFLKPEWLWSDPKPTPVYIMKQLGLI